MPLNAEKVRLAEQIQLEAARDASRQVRVVAGPGTGKSTAILERIRWLISSGEAANTIRVVSFTRAASQDLQLRILEHAEQISLPAMESVKATTLHSLALTLLVRTGSLEGFTVPPSVLDLWETEAIFDQEFQYQSNGTLRRSRNVRECFEAYLSTDEWDPDNYIPPAPPISDQERKDYQAFYPPRAHMYACVLPGDIVRQCLLRIEAGNIEPADVINLRHLIVDEYQDLNPVDQRFVRCLASQSSTLFVAGDDDQSVYSFRYAFPSGLQEFPDHYDVCGDHVLSANFRTTPRVLSAGTALITQYQSPKRIPKALESLFRTSDPVVNGLTQRWRFKSAEAEARFIASTCKSLRDRKYQMSNIMILVRNTAVQWPPIQRALLEQVLDFVPPKEECFHDTLPGRAILAIVRLVCNRDDYVSYRVLLGLLPGVGSSICTNVFRNAFEHSMNYRAIFEGNVQLTRFSKASASAISRVREVCELSQGWTEADLLADRREMLRSTVESLFGAEAAEKWRTFSADLPGEMTLKELRDFLWAEQDEQQQTIIRSICERNGLPFPDSVAAKDKIRVMMMHGSKGLSARIVFIPGLEADLIPGPKSKEFTSLVWEEARLLYVATTRARVACIFSYATNRCARGKRANKSASAFCDHLDGRFTYRDEPLTENEIADILQEDGLLSEADRR